MTYNQLRLRIEDAEQRLLQREYHDRQAAAKLRYLRAIEAHVTYPPDWACEAWRTRIPASARAAASPLLLLAS